MDIKKRSREDGVAVISRTWGGIIRVRPSGSGRYQSDKAVIPAKSRCRRRGAGESCPRKSLPDEEQGSSIVVE